jgi:hypothetical protein
MTTVLNGSTIIFNREGTTIESLIAQGGSVGSSTAFITRTAEITIVILATDETNYACVAPPGAEIGDVVEIFATGGNGWVYPPPGEWFLSGFNSAFAPGVRLRKVSSTEWIAW